MATWKKVIVSGSDAVLNQLTVSTNQIISQNGTKLTGSFTGSFTGDGSNLTGIQATSINADTITDIGNQGDFLYVSQSNGIRKITYENFLTDLTNGVSSNLEVDSADGIKLKPQISVAGVTASFTGSFKGDGSGLTGVVASSANSLTQGDGIQSFSYNGSTATTIRIKTGSVFADNVILKWDTAAGAFESSSLSDVNGVVSGQSSIKLTGTASSLTGSFTGSFYGDGSNLTGVGVTVTNNTAGNVLFATGTNTTLSGSAKLNYDQGNEILTVTKEIKFSASVANSTATFSSLGNISTASIFAVGGSSPDIVQIGNTNSTTFIGNNLVINGDLTTNGTASFINTQNLLVADRFITLASGSSTNGDGGIIVQNSLSPAGTGSGFAFYLETGTAAPRWSVTSSLNLNSIGGSVDEYMVTAKVASGNPSGNPTWGGTDGKGNMYVNTADESIWIYS